MANHHRASLFLFLVIAVFSGHTTEARRLLESLPSLPDVPKPEIPAALPKLDIPELPKPEIPELPKIDIPELPKPEIPELPKPEIPQLPKLEIPELPKPELPKLQAELPKFPEMPKSP